MMRGEEKTDMGDGQDARTTNEREGVPTGESRDEPGPPTGGRLPSPRRGGKSRAQGLVTGATTVTLIILAVLVPICFSGSIPASASGDKDAARQEEGSPLKTRDDVPDHRRNDAAFEDPEGSRQERARTIAGDFVQNVYTHGDDGRSPFEQAGSYTSKVAQLTDPGGFPKSPGAGEVDKRAKSIEDGEGQDVAARLVDFAPTGASGEAAEGSGEGSEDGDETLSGTATYEVGEKFDTDAGDGTVSGGVATYEQDLELVKWGATWKVKGAGEPRPVDGDGGGGEGNTPTAGPQEEKE